MNMTDAASAAVTATDQCDPDFLRLLDPYELALQSSTTVSACGIWKDFTIAYLSPGWFSFSDANGGEPAISERWGLGANLLSGITGSLRQLYCETFMRCLREDRRWEHLYDCSSPDRYRLFQMTAYPLQNAEGILITHAARIDYACDRGQGVAPDPAAFVDSHGLLHQCSYCRKVQRQNEQPQWQWVHEWAVQSPKNTSHSVCEACYGFYFSRLDSGVQSLEPLRT